MNDNTPEDPSNPKVTSKGATPVVPIDRAERLRESVRANMARRTLTIVGLSDELQLPRHALSRWLSGKPRKADSKTVMPILTDWLEGEEDVATERAARMPAAADMNDFVETPTSERIFSALAYAKENQDMAVLYGGPGVGKTRSISYFRSLYENVWVVTMTPSTAGVVPCLEEVAEAVGLREPSGGARRLARAIRSKVGPLRGIIIVDEAQHLTTSAIEELRSLHDACGVAIAFCGNETVYARMGGSRSAQFAQLASRLGMRVPFLRPGEGDVKAVARAWGVTDDAIVAVLVRVALQPGALRGVVKILRLASAGGEDVSLDGVRTACDHLGIEV